MIDTTNSLYQDAQEYAHQEHFIKSVIRCCVGLPNEFNESSLKVSINAGDQMFLHSLNEHREIGAALSQYFNIGLQQHNAVNQILEKLFGTDKNRIKFLDFACGYGRLLRFLELTMPRANIVASDIQSDALDFVGKTFEIETVPSFADPEHFDPGCNFDMIWVASLFSHLPPDVFGAWLRRLSGLLTENGVLCFSVRDTSLMPAGVAISEAGILYEAKSETLDLDPAIYGTTYASEHYVRNCVASFVGSDATYVRLRKSLAHEQDIYVLSKKYDNRLAALSQFKRGAWGWLDRKCLDLSGRLYLEGWAGSFDEEFSDQVEISIEGEPFYSSVGIERADVADTFNDKRLGRSGWKFVRNVRLSSIKVDIVCPDSYSPALIYSGSINL